MKSKQTTRKKFYEHQKILSAEELPRLTKDGGLDIEHDIERLENKILKRLLNREKMGNSSSIAIQI